MITFYTAIGRFESRSDGPGKKYPVIIVNQKEHMVSIPEMITWTCLNWHVVDMKQARLLFEYQAEQIEDLGYKFQEVYVERLLGRGLITSGVGNTDADALYDLLNNLHVIPVHNSSPLLNLAAFLKFVVLDGAPVQKAKEVFRKEVFDADEQRVVDLIKQVQLSVAEIIKCVELGIYDLPNEDKFIVVLIVLYRCMMFVILILCYDCYLSKNIVK